LPQNVFNEINFKKIVRGIKNRHWSGFTLSTGAACFCFFEKHGAKII